MERVEFALMGFGALISVSFASMLPNVIDAIQSRDIGESAVTAGIALVYLVCVGLKPPMVSRNG